MAWMETIVLNRQWMSEKKAGSEALSDRALLYGVIVYPILYINSIFCMVRSLMPVPERAGPETDFSFRNSSDRNGICVLSGVSILGFLQLLPAGPAWRLPGRAVLLLPVFPVQNVPFLLLRLLFSGPGSRLSVY